MAQEKMKFYLGSLRSCWFGFVFGFIAFCRPVAFFVTVNARLNETTEQENRPSRII